METYSEAIVELEWYFNRCVGSTSSFELLLAASGYPISVESELLDEADRAIPVRRRLAALNGTDRQILEITFDSPWRVPILDILSPLARFSRSSQRAYQLAKTEESFEEWLFRLVSKLRKTEEEKVLIAAIKRECETLLFRALKNY